MSAYIQFFVRHNDTFLPIGTFSRNSNIYSEFDEYIPWEHLRGLDENLLRKVRENVKEDMERVEHNISEMKEDIDHVMECNNSLDEKMERISLMREWIKECEDDLESLRFTDYFIAFLFGIIEEAEHTKYYDSMDTIDPGAYVYAGIEVSVSPTVENIVR